MAQGHRLVGRRRRRRVGRIARGAHPQHNAHRREGRRAAAAAGKEPASSLWFSAASEPELRVWHKMLRSLIDNLDSTARIARLHVHENSSRFAPAPFAEPLTSARATCERAS